MILDVLNYELTDVFTNLGMNTAGGEFSFVVPQNKDLSARVIIDQQLKRCLLYTYRHQVTSKALVPQCR